MPTDEITPGDRVRYGPFYLIVLRVAGPEAPRTALLRHGDDTADETLRGAMRAVNLDDPAVNAWGAVTLIARGDPEPEGDGPVVQLRPEPPPGWSDCSGLAHELERAVFCDEIAEVGPGLAGVTLGLWVGAKGGRRRLRRTPGLDYSVTVTASLHREGLDKINHRGESLPPSVELFSHADSAADGCEIAMKLAAILVGMLKSR